MAKRKVENIKKHLREHAIAGQLNFWFGDNGQGDEETAKQLLKDGTIHAAFIHKVQEKKSCLQIPNMHYFCTYANVAEILRDNYGILYHCGLDKKNYIYARECNSNKYCS